MIGPAAALLTTAMIAASAARAGEPDCGHLPSAVTAYLATHAAWRPVQLSDLNADDQGLWRQDHAGHCPGVAAADFDGAGRDSYALALLRTGPDGPLEKLVILHRRPRGSSATTAIAAYKTDSPSVVWRMPPGSAPHDSIVYEQFEAATVQYYFKGDRLVKIQTSD